MTPAETLREAAKLLRETAANVPSGEGFENWREHFDDTTDQDTAWIVLAHPGLGAPLAAWLDAEADGWEAVETLKVEATRRSMKVSVPLSTHEQALAVARAVLGVSGDQ